MPKLGDTLGRYRLQHEPNTQEYMRIVNQKLLGRVKQASCGAGYREIANFNANPFASFFGRPRWPGGPLDPVVVAGPGHPQHLTHQLDVDLRVIGLLRTDVDVDVYWSARRAKKASAFPRISSSSSATG